MHAGRGLTKPNFLNFCRSIFTENHLKVAVVGGSQDEIELQWIRELGKTLEVVTFGIDECMVFLDLNVSGVPTEYEGVFDLVICCQVLEHVWNLSAAVENLHKLARMQGGIYINCPASNHKHASPAYFSAGYQSSVLENHLRLYGFETFSKGEIGSERLYKMTHSHFFWPTTLELSRPFLRGVHSRPLLFPLKFVKFFVRNCQSIFWSNKVELGSRYATETWCAGKKLLPAFRKPLVIQDHNCAGF